MGCDKVGSVKQSASGKPMKYRFKKSSRDLKKRVQKCKQVKNYVALWTDIFCVFLWVSQTASFHIAILFAFRKL